MEVDFGIVVRGLLDCASLNANRSRSTLKHKWDGQRLWGLISSFYLEAQVNVLLIDSS